MQKQQARSNFLAEGHRPTRQPWIVPKLLRGRTLALLGAPPNAGKSFIALDLAFAGATGGSWLGIGPVTQSAVMVVMLDSTVGDSSSQFRRLTQEFADGGKANRDLIQDLVFRLNVEPGYINLKQPESINFLVEAANGFEHETRTWLGGVRPKVDRSSPEVDDLGVDTGYWSIDGERDPAHDGVQIIILDSLSKLSDAKESVAEEMGIVFSNLRKLAECTNALVLILHHDRKSSGDPRYQSSDMDNARGSGVITASLETYLALRSKSDETLHAQIKVVKQRGRKLPSWDVMLEEEGDYERDNEYALTLWDKHLAICEEFREAGEEEPEFTVESLYPSPFPYARARLSTLEGASPDLARLLRFIVRSGGTSDLEQCAQWVVDEGIITEKATPSEKDKAAKKWVRNRVTTGRKDGWLLSASEDAKGVYVASARARRFYEEAQFVDIDTAECETAGVATTQALAMTQALADDPALKVNDESDDSE